MDHVKKRVFVCVLGAIMTLSTTTSGFVFAENASPTQENFEAILAEYNAIHEGEYSKIRINWDDLYADYAAGKSIENNDCNAEGKPIAEMSEDEFWSYLDEIHYDLSEELLKYDIVVEEEGHMLYYNSSELLEMAVNSPELWEENVYRLSEEVCDVIDTMLAEHPESYDDLVSDNYTPTFTSHDFIIEALEREDYEEILDDFNLRHENEHHKVQIDWDALYADYEADKIIGSNYCNAEGLPVTSMSRQQFQAFLDEVCAAGEYDLTKVNDKNTAQPLSITTLTEQRYYYKDSRTAYQVNGNFLYSTFYWVSVDGYNRYSGMGPYGQYGSYDVVYPAFRISGSQNSSCSFFDGNQSAAVTYGVIICTSKNVETNDSASVSITYNAGCGNVYD